VNQVNGGTGFEQDQNLSWRFHRSEKSDRLLGAVVENPEIGAPEAADEVASFVEYAGVHFYDLGGGLERLLRGRGDILRPAIERATGDGDNRG
jgi:hypothetical protein